MKKEKHLLLELPLSVLKSNILIHYKVLILALNSLIPNSKAELA